MLDIRGLSFDQVNLSKYCLVLMLVLLIEVHLGVVPEGQGTIVSRGGSTSKQRGTELGRGVANGRAGLADLAEHD